MIQHDTQSRPLAMACVAAPEDMELLGQWERSLRPLEQSGLISVWSELRLAPGSDRAQAFQHHIESADLILLLLSADFFPSPNCLAMMERALERSHEGMVRVIPLLLRPVAWQESPLASLKPWPSGGVPITQWDDQETAWHACIQDLRQLLGRRVSKVLSSERPRKESDPDWDRMLRLLQRAYKELLDQSLHGMAWMELGLSAQPDLVSNVTNLLFKLPQGGERLLPAGTRAVNAYDEAEGELLILGAPGTGKSTLLLDLAQELVGRAQTGDIPLLPVILRLSTWAIRRPGLEEWMIEQLNRTYGVPRHLSERWIKQGCLLPLLDGLDEVEETARPACIAAINTYHRTHLNPLVVCSRQAEYEVAAGRERLALLSAVIVQPLSDAQIEAYLSLAGPSFTGIRAALHQQQALWELATTPLMLSVLLLTYRDASINNIVKQETDLERQVWTDYVSRQVAEKGDDARYPLARTRAWLVFLAQQMRIHQQTIFYAEYLDTDWLASDQQRSALWLAMRLPAMLIGVCVCLLVFSFLLGGRDYTFLLQIGLLGGFIGDCLSQLASTGPICVTHCHPHKGWVHIRKTLLLGVLFVVSYRLDLSPPYLDFSRYSFIDWINGLGVGLSFWLFQRILHHMGRQKTGRKTSIWPSRQGGLVAWFTQMASPPFWLAATVLGVGMGLGEGLSAGLSQGLYMGLLDGLDGLSQGLSVSVTVVLVHLILADSMKTLRLAERIHWTWHALLRPQHLRTSGCIAGVLFLCFGLSFGLINGLGISLIFVQHDGLSYGLSHGLSYGVSYGLSHGLSYGLLFWLLLGLYQGMKQEHLKDHDRQRFNQGLRRSLRNGLLLGLVSAIIICAIGMLSAGLSAGLGMGVNYGLGVGLSVGFSQEISIELDTVWILFLAGLVVMWALSGGLTVLRHYVIRWLLVRHHTFPWRAQDFLDDATTRILLRRVGGGYSFIHRRLQDYFADDAVPSPYQ